MHPQAISLISTWKSNNIRNLLWKASFASIPRIAHGVRRDDFVMLCTSCGCNTQANILLGVVVSMAVHSFSLSLLFVPLFISFLYAAPSSTSSSGTLSLQLGDPSNLTDIGALMLNGTEPPVDKPYPESGLALPAQNSVSASGPLCDGHIFGTDVSIQRCAEGLVKMDHSKGGAWYCWPGYGQQPNRYLPRRYSSCEYPLVHFAYRKSFAIDRVV